VPDIAEDQDPQAHVEMARLDGGYAGAVRMVPIVRAPPLTLVVNGLRYRLLGRWDDCLHYRLEHARHRA